MKRFRRIKIRLQTSELLIIHRKAANSSIDSLRDEPDETGQTCPPRQDPLAPPPTTSESKFQADARKRNR